MSKLRVGQAAALLGVSPDTVRRWIDDGMIAAKRTGGGHRLIDGKELARFLSGEASALPPSSQSARNRMPGIVTKVIKDKVAAHVELQAGPFRLVSLMTREAVDELGLEPGVLAAAVVKATTVVVALDRPSA